MVEPTPVCEVEFTEITDAGILRHPTLRGMRQDKRAKAITMERTVPRVTHPNKVLYPESGITKGDVAAHFERVAEWMLPHVAGRPLMLLRCPDGIDRCFVQKHATARRGALGRAVDMGDLRPHVTIDDAQGLIDLVQAGVIEVHTWGCHADAPERPDVLVFDLDPDPSVGWPDVIAAAELLRDRLKTLRLESFVKTTGGKGLHVACAIAKTMTWEAAKNFTRAMAEALVAEAPDRFVATMSKAKREGKIFVDYLRNARGATFVAPYSPRARPHAPIAMPLAWDELADLRGGDQFTIANSAKWLAARRSDPWRALVKRPQS